MITRKPAASPVLARPRPECPALTLGEATPKPGSFTHQARGIHPGLIAPNQPLRRPGGWCHLARTGGTYMPAVASSQSTLPIAADGRHTGVPRSQTATLRQYRRHAELYGPAEVLESAEGDLSPRQLGRLVGFMRELPPYRVRDGRGRMVVDPDWSVLHISRKHRDRLIEAMITAGEPDGWIAEKLGVGRGTVARIRMGTDPTKGSKAQQPPRRVNHNRGAEATGHCLQCGALFAQAIGRGRPRKYCSDQHRRAHQDELRKASGAQFTARDRSVEL